MKLPDPPTGGGAGIFEMLQQRSSSPWGDFPTGKISVEELSTLLWAATGLNRDGEGWTVPMAMGREPYCSVWVTGPEGTFLYDWKNHLLKEFSKDDLRGSIGAQVFVGQAPYVLIFTADARGLSEFGARGGDFAQVAVGAMTQNLYLAADALHIGTRYLANLKAEVLKSALQLGEKDVPLCIMPIGKK